MDSPFDLNRQNSRKEDRIVIALERLSQVFRGLLWQESKKFDLSPIQIQILIFVLNHNEEKRKVSYLAKEFAITKATVSDSVRVLEHKDLVRKEYDTGDSRSYILHLTPKGRNIAAETTRFTIEVQKPIEKLNYEEKDGLLHSLMSIIDHLYKAEVITLQRMCFSCHHYRSEQVGSHYCMLLNKSLRPSELRLDCPEHLINSN